MAPSGAKARYEANIAAIELAHRLQAEDRSATAEEQQILSRWSSWGAVPQVFDETNQQWAPQRARLRNLLGERGWADARRTTLNAHYTSPELVHEIWGVLTSLGLVQGRVLEPGCGSGTFIGAAPAGIEMIGIELDPTTAEITRALYPNATIRTESFANTKVPFLFDGFIGNVPFANLTLYDPVHNPRRYSIHNHFILKSLALTAPGGIAAVLTSRFTLDATNPAVRREIHNQADLLGAVRLPTGAHRRSAGTEAVTDLLILRRRREDETPTPFAWETTGPLPSHGSININSYFFQHPNHVLGRFEATHGMHNAETLHVTSPNLETLTNQLHQVLTDLTATARANHLTYQPHTPTQDLTPHIDLGIDVSQLWDGTIIQHNNQFYTVKTGSINPLKIPATQQAELGKLLQLRDTVIDLRERETSIASTDKELGQLRQHLLSLYTAYTNAHGPLNRVTLRRTGRVEVVLDPITGNPVIDPETGEPETKESYARILPPARRLFKDDPRAGMVYGLENYDQQTGIAAPSQQLTQRTNVPRSEPDKADNINDALAISLHRAARIDLQVIANLLDIDNEEARRQLLATGLAFEDPNTVELVHAPEYLSGNVREKLDAARLAAASDPMRYKTNVEALKQIQPDPVGPEDIKAKLGSVWISPQIHQQFLRETFADPSLTVENPLPGEWKVQGSRHGIRATQEWGAGNLKAPELAERVLNLQTIKIRDHDTGHLDSVETAAAQEKANALQERFEEWVWEDPERAATLTEEYNRRFRSMVLRDYTKAGARLEFPGLSQSMKLRPHQRAAVARMIAEPAVGLFHEVGAGKTAEMIVGATELRRLGMINKPAFVVPNHLIEDFSREYLRLYPQARILVASSEELSADKRREFVARAAFHPWDAVIFTQEAFKRIPLSPEAQSTYVEAELDVLRNSLDRVNKEGLSSRSVKQVENLVQQREETLRKLLDSPKDPGVNFEDTGIDYLLVDEAHMYKNLATATSIEGAGIRGSKQATDLHMKLEWLRANSPAHVATLATATPLANSITEAHVMLRYLRPDLLAEAGIEDFDAWAATFAKVTPELEMDMTGGFRVKNRFAKFENIPEFLLLWHIPADVKTSKDLNLNVPDIAHRNSDHTRAPEVIVIPPTQELIDYVQELGNRADAVSSRTVSSSEDNMLKIGGDGRKAALDMRLVNPTYLPGEPQKLDIAAQQIATIWHDTKHQTYLDVTGQTSSTPGSLQLVFCDLGTPKTDGWDAYNELKKLLIEQGLAPDSIRFIHEAKNDTDKARMFAAARAGHINVLIGSTAKMGVGTNVQDRIVAMHHIDCPWRPADLQQRDGRGIRQGNQNPEVAIFRYVTEASFDGYMWQTLERKAAFISQVMNGRIDVREIEDIGDTALSAAEAKALASGNPLLLERAEADNTLQQLRRQKLAHDRAQTALARTLTNTNDALDVQRQVLQGLEEAANHTIPTAGEKFAITIAGQHITSRTDAADAITRWAARNPDWEYPGANPIPFAQLGGHTLTIRTGRMTTSQGPKDKAILELDQVPHSTSTLDLDKFRKASLGTIRILENKITNINDDLIRTRAEIDRLEDEATQAATRLGRPFTKQTELDQAYTRLQAIDKRLEAAANHTPDQPPAFDLTLLRNRHIEVSQPSPHTPGPQPLNHEPTHHTHDLQR